MLYPLLTRRIQRFSDIRRGFNDRSSTADRGT
jgi:hypothetical protein